jgi:hypothetical protein
MAAYVKILPRTQSHDLRYIDSAVKIHNTANSLVCFPIKLFVSTFKNTLALNATIVRLGAGANPKSCKFTTTTNALKKCVYKAWRNIFLILKTRNTIVNFYNADVVTHNRRIQSYDFLIYNFKPALYICMYVVHRLKRFSKQIKHSRITH